MPNATVKSRARRNNRGLLNSHNHLARRDAYHRRLVCEELEDRRLLSVATGSDQQTVQLFNASPALFAENQGQWVDPAVRYVFQGDGANVAMTDTGPVFQVFQQSATVAPAAPSGPANPLDRLAAPTAAVRTVRTVLRPLRRCRPCHANGHGSRGNSLQLSRRRSVAVATQTCRRIRKWPTTASTRASTW